MGLINVDLKEGLTPKNIVWIVLVIAGAWLIMELQSRSMNAATRGRVMAMLANETRRNLVEMQSAAASMDSYQDYGSQMQYGAAALDVKETAKFFDKGYSLFVFSETNKERFNRLKGVFLKYGLLPDGHINAKTIQESEDLQKSYADFFLMLNTAMENGRNFRF